MKRVKVTKRLIVKTWPKNLFQKMLAMVYRDQLLLLGKI